MVVVGGIISNIHDGHEGESREDEFGPKLLSEYSLTELIGEVGDHSYKNCMHTRR